MQQAMEYADILNIPFAYSSNGSGFLEHDFFTGAESEFTLDSFPSTEELWQRYLKGKGLTVENINTDTRKKPMIRAFSGTYSGAWCLVGV